MTIILWYCMIMARPRYGHHGMSLWSTSQGLSSLTMSGDISTVAFTSGWRSFWERSSLGSGFPCQCPGKLLEQFQMALRLVSLEKTCLTQRVFLVSDSFFLGYLPGDGNLCDVLFNNSRRICVSQFAPRMLFLSVPVNCS